MHSGVSGVYARGTQPNGTRCTAKWYEVHSGILGRIATRNGRLAAPEGEAPGRARHLTGQIVDTPFRRLPVLSIESRWLHLLDESAILKSLKGFGHGAPIHAKFVRSVGAAENDSPVIAAPSIPVPIDARMAVAMMDQQQQMNGV